MMARLSITLATGLALGALGSGCTIHTYSGAAYPGTTFHSSSTHYEVSSARSRSRDRREGRDQTQARARERERARVAHPPSDYRPSEPGAQVHAGTSRNSEHQTHGKAVKAAPARQPKPAPISQVARPDTRGGTREARAPERVDLRPQPSVTKRHQRSFTERLGELVDQKNEALARRERERAERSARMQRVLGAAVDERE